MAIEQVCRSRGFDEYNTNDETHIMWWHRLDPLTPNARTGMVIAHGAGGTADYYITDASSSPIPPTAVSTNRMPVIATDMGGISTWGNSTAMTAMNDTTAFFSNKLGADDQVILLGISMGAATVLNWARTNPSKVAAIALHIPVVDLQDIIDNNRSGLGPLVTAAYGGNPPSASNPAVNTADFTGFPIRIWYSSNDPICIPSIVTSFASAVGATMTNLGAVNHTIAGIDVNDMVSWLAQHI